ncbi:phosphatidylglycerophosphatase A [Pedobacter sp. MC2016-14]|uniref:phosphatidylglycerophosphatase A family protein n=1 Tax=Pedobacter sp. MC2016-14 TaxID=2897327 RepID=UPI001E396BBC|nr:phosphatidylglycerophosphatase A [Pedobacter sp. MC2016-14]MCD0489752.1 phosphatidylglycerophosphatase A [Pedobacter sp. MC2016-14]
MLFHKITSTSLGIGYIGKGAGTVAAAATCLVWYFMSYFNPGTADNYLYSLVITAFITGLGIWSGNIVETIWGKDHQRVVIDEVAGMCITLLWIPVTLSNVLAGLVLFRFFDIVKPLYIKRLEALPGGWGVMFDDVLAGVYANIVLHFILIFNIL